MSIYNFIIDPGMLSCQGDFGKNVMISVSPATALSGDLIEPAVQRRRDGFLVSGC